MKTTITTRQRLCRLGLILVVILVAALFAGQGARIAGVNQQLDELAALRDQYLSDNQALAAELSALNDDETIEALAKRELNMAYPHEYSVQPAEKLDENR